MEKWKCNVCGYIYDPEKGDPDGNIPPNTPFNKLPESWVCPVCGAPKDMFEKVQHHTPYLNPDPKIPFKWDIFSLFHVKSILIIIQRTGVIILYTGI